MAGSGQGNIRPERKGVRKRIIFSAVFIVIAAVIVFTGSLLLRAVSDMDTLEGYMQDVLALMDSLDTEFETQKHLYEEDALARGELGLKFYHSELKPSDTEELEWVRSMCSAASVSILDKNRDISGSTGTLIPVEELQEKVRDYEPHMPVFETYSSSKEGEEYSGSILVMMPAGGEAEESLLFEFSCEPLVKVYTDLSSWPDRLFQLVQEAFIIDEEDNLSAYPEDAFDEEDISRLKAGLISSIQNRGKKQKGKDLRPLILLGRFYLSIHKAYPEKNRDLVMALPMESFIRKSMFTALVLLGFIITNILMFHMYALNRTRHESGEGKDPDFRRRVRQATLPGLIMMLAATTCFTVMFLMLGNSSIIARTAMSKRKALEYEINWHETQRNSICKNYADVYRTRTEVAAKLMQEPYYWTKEGLKDLCGIMDAKYLMLFDEEGYEILSSNSYTGFSVGGKDANLGEEYKAMILGYPSVVVGPEKDSYNGKMQINAAVLLDPDGVQPGGFLLASFSTGDLESVLESQSMSSTVIKFSLYGKDMAAVVNKEEGIFTAHSDPLMIGHNARSYLDESVLADKFEGFTVYGEEPVYISSMMNNNMIFMIIFAYDTNDDMLLYALLLLIVLILLELAEYLCVHMLCGNDPQRGDERDNAGSNSVWIFLDGYTLYLTLLVVVDHISAFMGTKTVFSFVFDGQWSRGIHLFSLWKSLFVIAITLCIIFVLRKILTRLDRSFNSRGRTIINMVGNVVWYLTIFFLVFCILYLYGVKDTVLLAVGSSIAVAFGFGARNLTADVLVGALIIVEDNYHIGDEVRVDGTTGHITNIGPRTVEITDEEKNVIIVNNSQVSKIVNLSWKKENGEG